MSASELDIDVMQASGRPTAREQVASALRRAIVRGELAPGEKLHPAQIAERYDVSQTPAREAVQLLASEGLVRINSFRGAHVSEVTAEEYEELYLMRVGLEGLGARLGAERISDQEIEEMAGLLDEMAAAAEADDIDRFYEHDHRFHLIHYSATGRESLVRRIMNLRTASERFARVAYRLPRVSMSDTIATHRELMDAVRARDGERCEQVIVEDLRRTLETFVERFGGDAASQG